MDLLKSTKWASQNFLAVKSDTKKTARKGFPERHRVIFFGKVARVQVLKAIKSDLTPWQMDAFEDKAQQGFLTENGWLWVLRPDLMDGDSETVGHGEKLLMSAYARARDVAGSWLRTQKISGAVDFSFQFVKKEEILGALVGLGVASYRYLDAVKEKELDRHWKFSVKGRPVEAAILHRAYALSSAMNLARHLANTPAADANPASISVVVKDIFRGRAGIKVEVLDVADLKKEKMGLLLGVGNGSVTGARLVHLRYRPTKPRNKKPLALVGKGVTFDTGGLDIKGSSNMRLMKKDMSGASAMAALAHFVSLEKLQVACDFYLPLAENAVSDRATRPGDVHRSRAGHLVEIDNTDAEGRLVMADAFDYALSQAGANAPEALFDVATLTGAMRVAVGLDVSGYFSNNDSLAKHIESAATDAGEMAWRLPLVRKYNRQLSSAFADFKNGSESGFGGAITAALFLEKFVKDVPWVHFDVMSWNNSADGAFSDGANAQCIQTLAYYLMKRG